MTSEFNGYGYCRRCVPFRRADRGPVYLYLVVSDDESIAKIGYYTNPRRLEHHYRYGFHLHAQRRFSNPAYAIRVEAIIKADWRNAGFEQIPASMRRRRLKGWSGHTEGVWLAEAGEPEDIWAQIEMPLVFATMAIQGHRWRTAVAAGVHIPRGVPDPYQRWGLKNPDERVPLIRRTVAATPNNPA